MRWVLVLLTLLRRLFPVQIGDALTSFFRKTLSLQFRALYAGRLEVSIGKRPRFTVDPFENLFFAWPD